MEVTIGECKAALSASEAAVAEYKAEGSEVEGQVQVLQAAHDEFRSQEWRDEERQTCEVVELEAQAEELAAERSGLAGHVEEAEASRHELKSKDIECVGRFEGAGSRARPHRRGL